MLVYYCTKYLYSVLYNFILISCLVWIDVKCVEN